MKDIYTIRDTCRGCNSSKLMRDVVNLGIPYIVDFPDGLTKDFAELDKAPLTLMFCEECHLLQMGISVDSDRLYKKFWYRSGISEVMRRALRDIVGASRAVVDIYPGDCVLDIGCNDGTMLSMYPDTIGTYGIDPAEELVAEAISSGRITHGFADYFSADKVGAYGPFKVITAIAMFYDLDDPIRFLKDCGKILHEHGVIILQFNYLKSMIENMAFDNIVHEHVTYFSLTTLSNVVKKAGLEIQGVQTNDVNGGSVRVFITHSGKNMAGKKLSADMRWSLYAHYQSLLMVEDSMRLFEVGTYLEFAQRISILCNVLSNYLKESKQAGLRTYAYGASTRGTSLLQTMQAITGMKMDDLLLGVAERDPHKYGKLMVGSWLPIHAEDEVRRKAQQFLMLPYHFASGIIEREWDWVKRGGKFLIPLPKPRVRSLEGVADLMTKEFSASGVAS